MGTLIIKKRYAIVSMPALNEMQPYKERTLYIVALKVERINATGDKIALATSEYLQRTTRRFLQRNFISYRYYITQKLLFQVPGILFEIQKKLLFQVPGIVRDPKIIVPSIVRDRNQ